MMHIFFWIRNYSPRAKEREKKERASIDVQANHSSVTVYVSNKYKKDMKKCASFFPTYIDTRKVYEKNKFG